MHEHDTRIVGKTRRARWAAALALLPLCLLSQPLTAKQPVNGGTALSPQESARRAALQEIEADRGTYVTGLLEKWHAAAFEHGFDPKWKIEAFARLMSFPAEKLLAAHEAGSFDEFRDIAGVGVNALGSFTSDLVYTPVPPCRVLDTRFASAPWSGPIPGNSSISFQVNDSFSGIPSQGGNPAGCPAMPLSEPAAVALTITAVPLATGNLRAYAYTGSLPLASVLNYSSGTNIANTTIVPACQGCGDDITVRVDVGATHIIVDVVGYFRTPVATPTDVLVQNTVTTVANGGYFDVFSPPCPLGWRVTGGGFISSYYEDRILAGSHPAVYGDTSFDGALGFNWADSWLCQGYNGSGSSTNVRCYVVCSRVPGL